MGEAAARPLIISGRECEGGKESLVDKSEEKTSPKATDGRKCSLPWSILE
jgi:hypothetical protein